MNTGLPRKKRILIGANDLLLAGVQRLVIDQLTTLDRSRYDVSLIVLMQFPGRETFYDRVPPDVSVHRLNFRGFADLAEWGKLIALLKEQKPDVVKTATFFSNSIFLVLKPFFGYKVICAEHNTVVQKPFVQRLVDWCLFPLASTILGDSQAVVSFVSESEGISRKRFTLLYNGVDLDAVAISLRTYESERLHLRQELALPEGAHVLFTAGRLVKQKNQALMIEGFAKVGGDPYLLIAGGGELRETLGRLAKERGVEARVMFLGEQKEVHRYYALADTFIMTSTREGFCISAMEGLAFGLPLISTRVAGISEYLEDGRNGFFVSEAPEDVAEKISRVMSFTKDEREQFRACAKATAERYSVTRYGEAFNALVGRVVG